MKDAILRKVDESTALARTFFEAQAVRGPVAVTAGLAVDHNETYGEAVAPRVSATAYLRKPSATSAVGDTKVMFNAGTGIKAPTLSEELSSLDVLVRNTVAGVEPIGPERSAGFDVGVEQGLWRGLSLHGSCERRCGGIEPVHHLANGRIAELRLLDLGADGRQAGRGLQSAQAFGVELARGFEQRRAVATQGAQWMLQQGQQGHRSEAFVDRRDQRQQERGGR